MNPSPAASRAVILDQLCIFCEPISPAVNGESESDKCEAPTRGLLSLLLIVVMRAEMSFPPNSGSRISWALDRSELTLVNGVRSCVLSGRSSEKGLGLLPGNGLYSWLCFRGGYICPQPVCHGLYRGERVWARTEGSVAVRQALGRAGPGWAGQPCL